MVKGLSRFFTLDGAHIYALMFVYNTNLEVLDWIKGVFGGRVHEIPRPKTGRGREWKQEFSWQAGQQQAATILVACIPYLKIKRRQAEIFAAHAASSKGRAGMAIPADVATFRAGLVKEIQMLNKRGNVAITRQPDGAPRA